MPFFFSIARKLRAGVFLRAAAVAAACASFPPSALTGILQTAASSLLEAVPLLLIAEWVGRAMRRPHLAPWLAGLIGCGCGVLPRTLSVPGAFLCTLAFGPATAAARWLIGLGLAARTARSLHGEHAERRFDAVQTLGCLLPLALWGALLSEAWRTAAPLSLPGFLSPVLLTLGLAVGASLPCDVGAVLLAATLHANAPWLAAGILAGAPLGELLASRMHVEREEHAEQAIDGGLARLLLAIACFLVALRGGNGLVHPRLALTLFPAAVLALAASRNDPPRVSRRTLASAALLIAAACSTPAPLPITAADTTLDHLFVTQSLHFTGEIEQRDDATTLVRYAITCCRADAAPLVLRLDHRLSFQNMKWIHVEGIVARDARGFFLRVKHFRRIEAPEDPFVYR